MVTSVRIVAILLLVFTPVLTASAEGLADRFGDAIFKIHIKHPAGREVAATGFLFHKSDHVATALHVVAGAEKIQVKEPSSGKLVSATVVRVLRDQDLALIKLTQPMDASPLKASSRKLKEADDVRCVGYPSDISKVEPTFLKVRTVGGKLKDSIPPRVRKDLDKIDFLSTNSPILNLDGHLLPGHSGAPVFSEDGELVAIGNGGLAIGASSRSWAIEARYLKDLTTSTEKVPGQSVINKSLFAEEVAPDERRVEIVASTGQRLVRIRKATFAEMFATTDDQYGLQQLVSTFPMNPATLQYDIYREPKSGATIVIPDGFESPTWEDGIWFSQSPGGLVTFYFQINNASNDYETQLKTTNFEQQTVAYDDPMFWSINPNWSYPFARPTLDGMSVRRLAYVKGQPGPFGPIMVKQLGFTHSRRGSLILSAGAKMNDQQAIMSFPAASQTWLAGSTSIFLTTLSE